MIATDRNGDGNVKVLIQSPQGVKLILAKKLLISIPPLVSNLAAFDLSTTERNLFAQWSNGAYYTALLRNTGIPDNVDVVGVGAGTVYNLPTCKHSHFPPPSLFHTFYQSRKIANIAPFPTPNSTSTLRHNPNRPHRPQRHKIRRFLRPSLRRCRKSSHHRRHRQVQNRKRHRPLRARIRSLQQPHALRAPRLGPSYRGGFLW